MSKVSLELALFPGLPWEERKHKDLRLHWNISLGVCVWLELKMMFNNGSLCITQVFTCLKKLHLCCWLYWMRHQKVTMRLLEIRRTHWHILFPFKVHWLKRTVFLRAIMLILDVVGTLDTHTYIKHAHYSSKSPIVSIIVYLKLWFHPFLSGAISYTDEKWKKDITVTVFLQSQ